MNPGRLIIPRMGMGMGPMMGSNYLPSRGVGLFGSIRNTLRGINWSGLLNGANKTLNVVNQTIPLVRQAGPMFNNMRSMMQLAKAFGSETNSGSRNRNNRQISNRNNSKNVNTNTKLNISSNNTNDEKLSQKKEIQNSNYPNFFI